jgi:hypothetical protein
MKMGWDYVSELQPPTPPIVHTPGDMWAWRSMVEWYCQVKIPDSSTRALWQSYKQLPSSKAGGSGEGNKFYLTNFASFIVRRVLLHAVKSYGMGPPALLPLRKKECCRFLSPLKIHRLRRGLNPCILSQMASTLTIISPEMTDV